MSGVDIGTRVDSPATATGLIGIEESNAWDKITIPAILARKPEIYVAANDSYNKEFVFYQCDGTADDVQIQAAIDSLPAGGGTVELLAGTFRLAQTVLIASTGITLKGQGRSTNLEPINAFANDTHMIKVYNDTTPIGCNVQGFRLTGANTTFTNPLVHGLWFTSENGNVDDVRVWQMSGDAMWIRNSVSDSNVSKAKFSRLDLAACGRHGLNAQSGDNHFSDSVFRANRDSNIYGSLTGTMWANCHSFASTENKAGTQTFYGMHLYSSDRNYFEGVKFEHAYKSPVWLDGNPAGGSIRLVNCPVRNGSGEGAGLHPQVLINRSGGATWGVSWSDSVFDADVGQPSWNIQMAAGANRNGRFNGNTYGGATVGNVTAFTSGTSGVGYRCLQDNQGVNAGDPNSTGDWFQAGRAGVEVWDTVGSKYWKCRVGWTAAAPAGVWVALT